LQKFFLAGGERLFIVFAGVFEGGVAKMRRADDGVFVVGSW
jgi:hypothetical protein